MRIAIAIERIDVMLTMKVDAVVQGRRVSVISCAARAAVRMLLATMRLCGNLVLAGLLVLAHATVDGAVICIIAVVDDDATPRGEDVAAHVVETGVVGTEIAVVAGGIRSFAANLPRFAWQIWVEAVVQTRGTQIERAVKLIMADCVGIGHALVTALTLCGFLPHVRAQSVVARVVRTLVAVIAVLVNNAGHTPWRAAIWFKTRLVHTIRAEAIQGRNAAERVRNGRVAALVLAEGYYFEAVVLRARVAVVAVPVRNAGRCYAYVNAVRRRAPANQQAILHQGAA